MRQAGRRWAVKNIFARVTEPVNRFPSRINGLYWPNQMRGPEMGRFSWIAKIDLLVLKKFSSKCRGSELEEEVKTEAEVGVICLKMEVGVTGHGMKGWRWPLEGGGGKGVVSTLKLAEALLTFVFRLLTSMWKEKKNVVFQGIRFVAITYYNTKYMYKNFSVCFLKHQSIWCECAWMCVCARNTVGWGRSENDLYLFFFFLSCGSWGSNTGHRPW